MLSTGDSPHFALRQRLAALSCELVVLGSFELGLASIRRREPDLLIIDDDMPVCNSFELLDVLQREALSPTVPVVVITARTSRAEHVALQQAGAWDACTLPLDDATLETRLRIYLAARRAYLDASDAAFVDDVTHLYSRRGMETRASEMATQCGRVGTPLSCIAFTVASADSLSTGVELDQAQLTAIGAELLRVGRCSDAIGRLEECDFAVLAPGAAGKDARQLANRLSHNIVALLRRHGVECDVPWVGRVLQPTRDAARRGEELLTDTILALQEVTAEHEIPMTR